MSGFTCLAEQEGLAPPSCPLCPRLDSISISSDNSSSTTISSSASSGSDVSTASGASLADALQQRRQHVGPNVALSYEAPLLMERGEGCYLFDEQGRQYLDCVNNVAHVGHGNAQVGDRGGCVGVCCGAVGGECRHRTSWGGCSSVRFGGREGGRGGAALTAAWQHQSAEHQLAASTSNILL